MKNNNEPKTSRSALRTLLVVLAIAVAIVIYAYGWNTTNINLDEVQDETRQASVQRAMAQLLSPNIFDRDIERTTAQTQFAIGCEDPGAVEQPPHDEDEAYIVFTPPCADVDQFITVEGFNFPADAIAGLRLVRESGQNLPFKRVDTSTGQPIVTEETSFDVDNEGYFKVTLKVPRGSGLSGQTHTINIPTASPVGWPRLSNTTHEVIDKMIETIFLALMATTLALPVSVALSFLAARNLMRQVTMPLGTVLVGFVLLPVGGVLGYLLIGQIGSWGVELAADYPWLGIVGPVGAFALFAAASRGIDLIELPESLQRAKSFTTSVLMLIALIFSLGTLGGAGIWIGEQLDTGIAKYLGQFVETLGTLVELTIKALAALGSAFLVASVGATISATALRSVRGPASNVLSGVLGMLSGMILLASTSYIGTQAVLLGLLTTIVAAVLGGHATYLIYRSVFKITKPRRDETATDQMMRTIIFVIGAVSAFVLTAYVLDLPRAIVDEREPSTRAWELIFGLSVRIYVAKAAIIGAVLGGIAGLLSGAHTSFPLGMSVYNTTRTILNALRAIEPLIMGIVFVIWVGVGPFAGVLALTLHSIASLGKLYSEQVENIDAGPIEAIQATGATRLQTIIYGVVPQIVPPYIAFTIYRWDINVRMSTIIGFVGGGGIGFVIQQQINLLQYRQAGVAVLAIAIVVSVLDYASAAIRERIV